MKFFVEPAIIFGVLFLQELHSDGRFQESACDVPCVTGFVCCPPTSDLAEVQIVGGARLEQRQDIWHLQLLLTREMNAYAVTDPMPACGGLHSHREALWFSKRVKSSDDESLCVLCLNASVLGALAQVQSTERLQKGAKWMHDNLR